MGNTPQIEVTVCTWEPRHTLARVEAQQRALAKGTIAGFIKKYGRGTDALRSALVKAKLVSVQKNPQGNLMCPECGALMDTVLAALGVVDKVEAMKDVAENFPDAITRTRQARQS